MKINKLNIEKFGAIEDKEFSFESGLNHFARENEFGKSTIIEAIKTAIYGFNPVKNYPYLPLSGEAIKFDCSIELDEENEAIKKVTVERRHSSLRPISKLLYGVDGEKAKSINNKSIFSSINEEEKTDLKELPPENWLIDSDSIEEHKSFLKTIDDANIGLYESVNYKGNSLDNLSADIDRQKKAIYTNNANSNSEFKKNEDEIKRLTVLIKEVSESEDERRGEYDEFISLQDKKQALENEIEKLKLEKKGAESAKDQGKLISEYKKVKKEFELNSFDNMNYSPKSRDLIRLKEDLGTVEEKLSALEVKQALEAEKNFDKDLIALVSLNRDKELKKVFERSNEIEQWKDRFREKEEHILNSPLKESVDMEPEKAMSDLMAYQQEYRRLEKLRDSNKSKSVEKIYTGLFIAITIATVVLGILGIKYSLLGIPVIIFLGYKIKKADDARNKYAKDINNINVDEFKELMKLDRGSKLLKSMSSPSNELVELIKKDLFDISEYQKLKNQCKRFDSAFSAALENYPDIAEVLNNSDRSMLELSDLYKSGRAEYALSKKLLDEYTGEIETLRVEREGLNTSLAESESKLQELWGTTDLEKVDKKLEEAKILQHRIGVLEEDAEKLGVDLNEEVEQSVDIFMSIDELDEVIVEKEEELSTVRDTYSRLEERLSKRDIRSIPYYQDFTVEELKEVLENLRNKNKELSREYNVLCLKEKLISRSFEILKGKLKPTYIQKADEYLNILAENCKINIEYSAASEIVFKDKDSLEYLSFNRLSSGTQAQVVFSLKLAYLDEEDKEYVYPVLIDDAFMAYDEVRKAGVLKLLEEVSKKRQVIYFESA